MCYVLQEMITYNNGAFELLVHPPYTYKVCMWPILPAAVMPWIAEYLLIPLVVNHFTAFGRGALDVAQAIRRLIPDTVTEPKGPQIRLKVIYSTC